MGVSEGVSVGVSQAESCTKGEQKSIEYGIFTGEAIHKDIAPKEAIIEGILSKGDNLIISAKQGIGKSILGLQLVHNLTTGTDFLDTYHVPKVRPVLFLQTEGDRADTNSRLLHMGKALKIDDTMWAHCNVAGITLNTDEGYKELVMLLDKVKLDYEVLIIDCVYPTVKGSLSDDEVATDWQRNMRRIREKYTKLSIVGIYHDTNKEHWESGKLIKDAPDNLFGTSMWGNWVTANYKLEKRGNLYIMHGGKGGGKGRSGQGVSEIHMRLIEPSPLYYELVTENLNETESRILATLKHDPTKLLRRIELEELLEKSKPTVCRALTNLLKSGRIEKIEKEYLVYYKIKEVKDA